MESFKKEYIYPIISKINELRIEYIEQTEIFKHDVQLLYKKTIFYLFIILFIYYFKGFFFYLLDKFDKLLTN